MDTNLLYTAEPSLPGREPAVAMLPDLGASGPNYAHKSEQELRLSYWMFRLMGHPGLVRLATGAANWALKNKLPVNFLIKHSVYKLFCGGESIEEALGVIKKLERARIQTVLDYAAEAEESEAGFEEVKQHILQNIRLAGSEKGIGAISVKLSGLGYAALFEKVGEGLPLKREEKAAFKRTGQRLEEVCREAASCNICVYLDAEESWIQEPIDALAEHMMQLFNKERVVIFNTLQMYRTDRLSYLQNLIARTEGEPYLLGIKLVRGAYWEKEGVRAAEKGMLSPVFRTKEETDRDFNQALLCCLDYLPKVNLCIATHNMESTELLVSEIRKRGIQQHLQWLHFSQLYGMSDNLSFGLAQAGYSVSKYLPYGEVEKALPYLIRRAEENTAIAGQMGRELALLKEEMLRRKKAKK